jgi:multicomponent K+:H+ antiporter subunit D
MTAWIDAAVPKLIVAPVVIPLAAAAVLLLIRESSRQWKAFVNLLACTLSLAVAIVLMRWVDTHGPAGAVGVYLASNWQAPFGIVLAVDRLSALMLVLTGVISIASVLFATARWQHAGVHYHSLLQIQLMGVNGAFLTADLFNLFVFFEVMLAASYGLLLHGSGRARVSAGLKYVAVNLLASSLFLIGVAIIYGITGTLNYADIAQKIPLVPAADRGLLHAGAAILGIAFLAKAAMWPLNFWLAPAYSAASASVAALFVLLTKVGVYTVLRLWTLLLSAEAGAAMWFGADALVFGGLATMAFGAIGVLASHRLRRSAGFAVIISSGTLLAAIGIGHASLIGGALYYLVVSTLAVSALFLLIELIERSREFESAPPTYDNEADHLPFYLEAKDHGDPVTVENGDDATLIGRAIPAATAFLGLAFTACALLIAGLPPLSGFLAKFAMLSALLDPAGVGTSMRHTAVPFANWTLLVLLIVSGLLCMVGLSRAGVRHFWAPQGRPAPRLRIIECVPVAALLALCAWLAIRPGPVLDYTQAAAAAVVNPVGYVEAVMSATPVPPPSIGFPSPVARR